MLLRTIDIPLFIKSVKLADAARPRYYRKGDKIPKRYAHFGYDSKGLLVDGLGRPLIRNTKTVGLPRMKSINGQSLYDGTLHPRMRSRIVLAIKDSFRPSLEGIAPITGGFPVRLKMELHDQIGTGLWDLDNLWFYNKCFQDLLVRDGILPEDNVMYITAPAAPEFVPVEREEDRRLVFYIYSEERDIILQHPRYAQFHSNSQPADGSDTAPGAADYPATTRLQKRNSRHRQAPEGAHP